MATITENPSEGRTGLSEVQKIQLVLDAALELAYDNGYRFINLPGADVNETKQRFHEKLTKMIGEKRELLSGVPKESQTYQFMLQDARLTIESLKIGNYNIPVIRFINGFLKLESLFINNVRYVGERALEEQVVRDSATADRFGPILKERAPEAVNQTLLELEEGVTGEQLAKLKKIEKELYIEDIDLGGISLEDEEDVEMTPEQISKLGLDESEDGESFIEESASVESDRDFVEEDFVELHKNEEE